MNTNKFIDPNYWHSIDSSIDAMKDYINQIRKRIKIAKDYKETLVKQYECTNNEFYLFCQTKNDEYITNRLERIAWAKEHIKNLKFHGHKNF